MAKKAESAPAVPADLMAQFEAFMTARSGNTAPESEPLPKPIQVTLTPIRWGRTKESGNPYLVCGFNHPDWGAYRGTITLFPNTR